MKYDKWILTAILILTIASWSTARVMAAANHPAPPHHWTGKMLTLPQRMRGVNVPSYAIDPALIKRLAKWHCNAMRINFGIDIKRERHGKPLAKPTKDNPLAPYKVNLKRLDAILPVCQKLNIRIILSAATIYHRHFFQHQYARSFWSHGKQGKQHRQYLIDFWKAFATRYKGAPAIVAYDVMNEPHYKTGQEAMWYDHLLPKAVATIRAINPSIWLVVEPGPWGLPGGFANMPTLQDKHVIYSFHMYAPHSFVNQGVGKNRDKASTIRYPGMMKNFPTSPVILWNKKTLARYMKPALDFSRKHHVRILVGECGVSRWAPNRSQWLADNISLFEKYHFNWLWHSPAGWNGWNQTFAPDAPRESLVGKNSDGGYRGKAMQVLLKGWAKNERETK